MENNVNYQLLEQAMDKVARARFNEELRSALAYGPVIFSEIFAEYNKLLQEDAGSQIDITE